MRNPKEAAPGEVAPYYEQSKIHEFVGDLKLTFAILTFLALALSVFLLMLGLSGALFGAGLLLFAAGGWVTMAIVDARAWKTHRSARDAAMEVTEAMAGPPPGAAPASASKTAAMAPSGATAAAAAEMAGPPEPGESMPRLAPPTTPAREMAETGEHVIGGGKLVVGFLLVALVLAAAFLGTNRLALGILLFFALAIFYGWPFLIAAVGGGGEKESSR